MSTQKIATARLPASERRRRLERAATELFTEHGFAATTVERIVARAGVTKPMFYRHFETKQELVILLLERHRHGLAMAPLDALRELGDRPLAQRTEAMLHAWFQYLDEHPFAGRLLTPQGGDPEIDAVIADLHDRQRAADVALLRELAPGIPEGQLPPLGEIIRAALSGLGLWSMAHADTARADVIAAMLRMLLGLVPESASRSPLS